MVGMVEKSQHPNACSRDLCFQIAQNDVIEWSMSDIHNPSLSIPWLFPCVFLLETLVCQKKNPGRARMNMRSVFGAILLIDWIRSSKYLPTNILETNRVTRPPVVFNMFVQIRTSTC